MEKFDATASPSPSQGSEQIRQAFSKRKKGLVLKAYQLNALTDAQVGAAVREGGTSSDPQLGGAISHTACQLTLWVVHNFLDIIRAYQHGLHVQGLQGRST